ncbi:MAG: HEPN domain-containing protein [Calditrichaeota bacterium]|nr:HEPN domain-containing protein [Calditrichota bacterium]
MSDKNDLIKEWIHKAENDLGIAELALEHGAEFTDAICFHCQQACEKYFKAYLVYLNVKFSKTHSLAFLLDLINESDPAPDKIYDIAGELEGYAVEIRYPDDWFEPTINDAKEAFQNAEKIKSWVLDKLKDI